MCTTGCKPSWSGLYRGGLNYAPAKAGGIGRPLKAARARSRLRPAESPGAASPLKPWTETPSRAADSGQSEVRHDGSENPTSGVYHGLDFLAPELRSLKLFA
jgi:hypothetical protein